MSNSMNNIQEELKKLPDKPGVYLMHDAADSIIYVGKAVNLRNRVRSYFRLIKNRSPKIERMISLIDHFEYIVVDSEMEALVLENNLIKEHHPKYNTMLMDDKTYPYIMVTVQEMFPRVMSVRQQKRDKARYFGPYTSGFAVNDTLDLLRKLYCIRTCSKKLDGSEVDRPCLYYHLKQCKGPCQGNIPEEEYRRSIEQVIEFLNGNYSGIKEELKRKMQEASEALEFEDAAGFRDLLTSVEMLSQKQKITNTDVGNRDIIGIATAGEEAVVQVFFIRAGKMVGREHFHLSGESSDSRSQVMTEFVKQYYAGTPDVPRELWLSDPIEEAELIAQWLSTKSGQKVYIRIPKKGEKERFVELAEKNASIVLQKDSDKLKKEEARTLGALQELGSYLDMVPPKRIEAFDISNTNGFESVGSMIVYEDGRQKRSDYRKFKIRTVQGPDDYASMREVLTRRFTHGIEEMKELESKNMAKELGSFTKFPQLIMMDGGRGQVNIALEVLQELKLDIAVCGMVKDDNHRTRGLYYNNVEIPINLRGEAFRLITRIQDETHRFAIEYHRSLRSKEQVHSILDDIKGIGGVRRRALMKYFGSFEAVSTASKEELRKVPGMNQASAAKVYEFFHKNKPE